MVIQKLIPLVWSSGNYCGPAIDDNGDFIRQKNGKVKILAFNPRALILLGEKTEFSLWDLTEKGIVEALPYEIDEGNLISHYFKWGHIEDYGVTEEGEKRFKVLIDYFRKNLKRSSKALETEAVIIPFRYFNATNIGKGFGNAGYKYDSYFQEVAFLRQFGKIGFRIKQKPNRSGLYSFVYESDRLKRFFSGSDLYSLVWEDNRCYELFSRREVPREKIIPLGPSFIKFDIPIDRPQLDILTGYIPDDPNFDFGDARLAVSWDYLDEYIQQTFHDYPQLYRRGPNFFWVNGFFGAGTSYDNKRYVNKEIQFVSIYD